MPAEEKRTYTGVVLVRQVQGLVFLRDVSTVLGGKDGVF